MIDNLFSAFVEVVNTSFEILLIFIFLNGFLISNNKPFYAKIIAYGLAFTTHFCVSIFLHNVASGIFMLLSYTVISITLSILFYSAKLYVRIFSPLLLVALAVAIEIMAMLAVTSLGQVDLNLINGDPLLKAIAMGIKYMLMLTVIKAINYFRKSNTSDVKTGYRLMLLVVPMVSLLIVYVIFDLIKKTNSHEVFLYLIGLIGVLYANIIVFAIFEGFMRQMNKEYSYKLMEKQLDLQLTHYNELAESRARIREIWHDFKNHAACLHLLYQNNDKEALGQYIKNLTQYGESNKVIDTGNPVIDALLNHKQAISQTDGIGFKTELLLPASLSISPADACVILGNSLDNAIEACKRIKNPDIAKEITLSLTYQNGYLVYVISNPIDEMPQKAGKHYKTWKSSPELHGLGLQSIERIVKQYEGNMLVTCEKSSFRVEIVMSIGNAVEQRKEGA